MPTLIGTTPEWGVESDELGIIIDGIDYDYKMKEKESLDKGGEIQGINLYGESCDVSLKGEIPTETPSQVRLASSLTLANDIPDHFQAAPVAGRNVVKTVKVGYQREDFRKFEVGSTFYPTLPAEV